MKYLLVVLALMPLALASQEVLEVAFAAQDRSISSQIVDAIEAAKEQMPCGFPSMGIPPLAPLKISHQELNIDSGSLMAVGTIDNFRLYGLNDFDILQFRIQALLRKGTFEFNWNHVYLDTDYALTTRVSGVKMTRSGNAKFALKNLRIWGNFKYSMGLLGGAIKLNNFDLYISVGEVISDIGGLSKIGIINRKLNQVIEEWVYLAINDNTDYIPELTNGYLVPAVNNMIGDMTLSDILGMIGGGSGGSNNEGGQASEPVEKVPCVPPEDD
ncbi:uncharacterized protein [Musca autumnalis]|uniref:uncharacterized protein n=1 Tax=Musca autumnalis TaxID=221902 RepID=UPI003CEA4FAB